MPINVLGTHFNAHYFALFLSSKLMLMAIIFPIKLMVY